MEMKIDRDLVRKLRIDKSWSQETLAAQSGLHLRTVQRVETNGVASLQTRLAIATALGIEPQQLLNDDSPDGASIDLVQGEQAFDGSNDQAKAPASEAGLFGDKGRILVALNVCVVALTLGLVVLDQVYAWQLRNRLPSADMTRVFSEVSDFLLQFGFLTLPITLGALVVVWKYRWARLLLIASIAFGGAMEVFVPLAVNVFLPELWIALAESGAGAFVRFFGHASAAVFAFWAWLEFSRQRSAPVVPAIG